MGARFKRTKILATVGPATNGYEQIEAMVRAGANGFRLNFSHATYESAGCNRQTRGYFAGLARSENPTG